MELDGALGPSELSPVEQGKGQIDDAGIQTHKLVPEPELFSCAAACHTQLTFCQELLKHGLVERPGTVGIGICESGAFRGNGNAQVLRLALGTGQSSADLPQAVSPAKLTEEHGDKLAPARKSFGSVVGAVLFHRLYEFKAGKRSQGQWPGMRHFWQCAPSLYYGKVFRDRDLYSSIDGLRRLVLGE